MKVFTSSISFISYKVFQFTSPPFSLPCNLRNKRSKRNNSEPHPVTETPERTPARFPWPTWHDLARWQMGISPGIRLVGHCSLLHVSSFQWVTRLQRRGGRVGAASRGQRGFWKVFKTGRVFNIRCLKISHIGALPGVFI